jgi:ABC-2 type transport system permease protein
MLSKLQLHLTSVFLKIFLRDRQSIFFSLFFPIIFMTVFSFINGGAQDPIKLGLVNNSGSAVATNFVQQLIDDPLFNVSIGLEDRLRNELEAGEQTMLLILPEQFNGQADSSELRLLVDAAQVQQLGMIVPLLQQKLITIEREFRNLDPMFSLAIEDVQARSQSYLDFLLPGLLAFTLMQLSIAGSGFNIVEYRRKGILKRLFVTPIRPTDFIASIVIARMAIVLIQLTVLILFAVLVLDVNILGNFASLYLVVILGTIIFLNLGFCLGSLAKTQQAVMAVGNIVIFPQIFLSGVFYPIESMPELVQPIARALPLSFVATGMRDIANEGASLLAIWPSLLGIAVWLIVGFVLATRLFVWKEVAN